MEVRALRREMLRYQRLDFEKWTTQRPCGLWGASTERRERKGGVQPWQHGKKLCCSSLGGVR